LLGLPMRAKKRGWSACCTNGSTCSNSASSAASGSPGRLRRRAAERRPQPGGVADADRRLVADPLEVLDDAVDDRVPRRASPPAASESGSGTNRTRTCTDRSYAPPV